MNKIALETFIRITEENSFSRAAEKMHITQPAVSKRIAILEETLNTLLFDRIGKEVQLTLSGEILLEHSKEIIKSMNDCKTAIQNLNKNIEGILKLGVSHHIGLHRLPPYLEKFSKEFPKVQLNINFVDSEKAYQLIQHGELEIALATLSPVNIPHVAQKTIWQDPLTFVVNGKHPLAKTNESRILSLKDLSKHNAILPGDNTYTGQLVQNLFKQENENISHNIETNYLETIKMLASIGLGWAVLPRTMLDKKLRGLHVDIQQISRNLGYIHHESRTLSNASKALLNTLAKPL